MNKTLQFIISTLVAIPWLGMVLLSFLVVPFMCLTKWNGKTTWFGNFKYGRGDDHYKAPSAGVYWKQVRFLCIRNPVSNFGKQVLSVKEGSLNAIGGAWLNDHLVVDRLYWMYGWKNPTDDLKDDKGNRLRSFVYRPWFKGTRTEQKKV